MKAVQGVLLSLINTRKKTNSSNFIHKNILFYNIMIFRYIYITLD